MAAVQTRKVEMVAYLPRVTYVYPEAVMING
jgi:hypothetical protein